MNNHNMWNKIICFVFGHKSYTQIRYFLKRNCAGKYNTIVLQVKSEVCSRCGKVLSSRKQYIFKDSKKLKDIRSDVNVKRRKSNSRTK